MRQQRGFTLIEVIIAMVIMTGAIVLLAQTWSGNYSRVRKSNLYNNVAVLIERKMAELESEFQTMPVAEIPEELSGDFGKDFPQYRWAFQSQEFVMPDLSAALTAREGGADEMLISMIRQMSDYFGEAIKEGKLSVFVKAGKREVEYSVTTYFVDYDKEIALGPGGGSQ